MHSAIKNDLLAFEDMIKRNYYLKKMIGSKINVNKYI